MKNNDDAGLVYSSDTGSMCPKCGRVRSRCICQKEKPALLGDGIVRISQERKGRKGKGVTLIQGLPLSIEALSSLAKKLKVSCGTGGTVKAGIIEIQGEHIVQISKALKKEGYTVRRSGG